MEEVKAKEAQQEHKRTAPGKPQEQLRKVSSSDSVHKKRELRTRDKVAAYAGVSGRTLEKIEEVVDLSEGAVNTDLYDIALKAYC